MLSIMIGKLKKIGGGIIIISFWLVVWAILARKVQLSFALPTVGETFNAGIDIITNKNSLLTILLSLVRIGTGFFMGVIIALGLGILSVRFSLIKKLLSPLNIVAKSTPVAVIITIIWFMIGGARVPGTLSAIMVIPIVWQSILDGYEAIDPQLDEVCKIYNFGFVKRLRFLVFPTLMRFLLPSLLSASGLAFKAGISAEILCMTKNSIGYNIYNSKYTLEGPSMFAWTVIVLVLSCFIEQIIKLIIEGVQKKCRLN